MKHKIKDGKITQQGLKKVALKKPYMKNKFK